RSFLDPQGHGSVVGNRRMSSDIACFLYRYNQVLVTLRSQGSALLPKSEITELLYELRRLGITTNLFQHSALSFSFCFDLKPGWRDALVGHCEGKFDLYYNEGLHLATIKNASKDDLRLLPGFETKYLEQTSRNTYQVLYAPLKETS
ncbi:MAG: hypothetical protein AAGA85_14770, partial [Bacteroidota bacterium]